MIAAGLATVRNVHQGWAWVVVIGNGVAGVWSLAAHPFAVLRVNALWWFIGAAQLAVFVQALLGAIMVGRDQVPLPEFHAFYGFVAIVSIAIIYSYRIQMKHRLYLLYGGGSLFVMGLGIRSMLIATGV